MDDAQLWRELGQQFRVDSVRCAAAAKSGHPTSGMSAADLMAVLLAEVPALRLRRRRTRRRTTGSSSRRATRRRSCTRCSAPPARSRTRSCSTYRQFGSMLEGHPTPLHPVGGRRHRLARPGAADRRRDGDRRQVPRPAARTASGCSAATARSAEGSIWEAFEHASHYELDNLTAIFDVNRLGQRGQTMDGWELDHYARARARRSAGTRSRSTATTSRRSTRRTPRRSATTGQPTVVIARTIKGKGVKAVENKDGWHGKPLDDPDAAIEELGGLRNIIVDGREAGGGRAARLRDRRARAAALRGRLARSRRARRTARRWRRSARRAATWSRSTARSRTRPSPRSSRRRIPERFFEMYIAEQQMVAAAVGLQARG